ncbi:MAG: hypothetical protein V1792_09480 [Pseudomonadota bacterium]
MSQRRTLFERIAATSPTLTALAEVWTASAVSALLYCFWKGCDDLLNGHLKSVGGASPNDKNLERSLNALLDPLIQDSMPQESFFYFQHEPPETETMHSDGAKPPTPDFGFRMRANPQRMWPIEAKVLRTDGDLAEYLKEVRSNFLTCRYGPFSTGGAILGYLLKGKPSKVFDNVEKKLKCALSSHPDFLARDHKTSDHQRTVPKGKPYPRDFRCHHLILRVGKGHVGDHREDL